MKTKMVKISKIFIATFLIFATSASGFGQITSWAKVYMNSSTASTVDVEIDANGNSYTVGNFASTINANYGVNTSNMLTASGGQDIFIVKHDATGSLLWVKQLGGSGEDIPVALDIDASGNVVVVGTFTSTNMDFNPGTAVNNLSSTGSTDLFVLKLSTNGDYIWAQRSGGTQGELMTDVEFDSNGDIYLAGSFTTINDFFSNTNTVNTGGARDAFLCKLNAAGTFQWVKVIGGAGTDIPNRVNVAGTNVTITTDIGSGSTTFDFGTGTKNGTFSGTGTNGIMTHYYSSGNYAGKYHFTGNTSLTKVITTGSVTMAIGSFEGSMDVDPSTTTNTITSKGIRDMFVIVLNGLSDGTYRSHIVGKGATSVGHIFPVNVMGKMGANSGKLEVHIVGYAKASADMGGTIASDIVGPNNTNEYAFLARYTYDEGVIYNVLNFAANIAECGTSADFSKGTGVAVKSNGDILTTGWYRSTAVNSVTFQPNSSPTITPIFSTSIGFTQYIKNCVMPTTTASTTTYSICSGASASLVGSGATTYAWNTGATTANISVSPTTTTTYTLTGTNGECSKTDTVKIIVKTPPTTLAISNDYSICNGTSAILTGSGATTYAWNTGATTASITVNPIVTTTYTLTGTTNGCTKTDTVKVIVSALPTTLAVSNDYSICSGTNVTLSGSGATTYSWNTGATSSSISVTPMTTTIYTLTGTINGCIKTDTVKITVLTSPTTIASTAKYSICAGESIIITGSGATTYAWNTGATGANTTVTPSTTTTYTLTGTTAGCSLIDTVKITVKALPNTVASTSSYSICKGSSAILIGSGATTYSWNIGGTTASITETPTVTTIYALTGTTNGCSKIDTVKITVKNLPTIVANTSTYGICIGSSATLTATGSSTFTWNTGASGASYSVSPTNTTIYTVTGIANGCSNTDTVKITVKSIPITVASANLYTPCINTSTQLNGSGATTYSWSTGATGSSALVSPAITTTYTLTGTTNGCSSTDTVKLTINPTPTTPVSTTPGANLSICSNSTTTLSASGIGTITWFDVLSGGSPLATGSNFTTPSLTTTKTYYVQASSVCGTSGRLPILITVNNTAIAPSNTTQISSICIGASATIRASAGGTIKWYTVLTGGSEIATGTSYVTPILNANTTYYAENNSTCGISARTAISVTVNAIPTDPIVPSISICGSESKTISTSSSHSVRWHQTLQSTESFFTGATYITPILSAATTYYVEGYNNGCVSPNRIAITIPINPLPTINSVQNSAICAGNSTTVSATGIGTITWYADMNSSTALYTGTNYVTPILNTNTSYYALSTNSCGSTPRLQIAVPVNPLPETPISTTSLTALTICPNSSTSLSVASVDQVLWYTSLSGGNSIANGNLYSTANLNTNTTYYAEASNLCGVSSRLPLNIVISSTPSVPSNVSSQNNMLICEGENAELNANASGIIYWYDSETSSSSIASGVSFNTPKLNTTTIYYLENESSCGKSARISITVNVKSLPNTNVTVTGNTLTSEELNANYTWINCGTNLIIPSVTQNNYTATTTGDYAVIVDKDGCIDTSSCKSISILGLEKKTKISEVSVFPNPSNKSITINNLDPQVETIKIIDCLGKIVYENDAIETIHHVDVSNFNVGIYYVQIINETLINTKILSVIK